HHVDARLETRAGVLERDFGSGEVDHHVGVAENVLEGEVELRVHAAHQRQVVGALDGLADGLAHAPGRAADGHVDHGRGRYRARAANAARTRSRSWGLSTDGPWGGTSNECTWTPASIHWSCSSRSARSSGLGGRSCSDS